MTEVFKILSNGTYQLGGSPTTVDDAVYVRISNMSTGGSYVVQTRENSGGPVVGQFRIAPLESFIFKKEPSHYVYSSSGNLYCASVAPNP